MEGMCPAQHHGDNATRTVVWHTQLCLSVEQIPQIISFWCKFRVRPADDLLLGAGTRPDPAQVYSATDALWRLPPGTNWHLHARSMTLTLEAPRELYQPQQTAPEPTPGWIFLFD